METIKKLLFISCLFILSCCGKNKVPDNNLSFVDIAVARADNAQKKAFQYADSISFLLQQETDQEKKFDLMLKCADLYSTLDLTKSLEYLKSAHSLALRSNNPDDSIKTLLRIASLFNSEGLMIKEAAEIFERIKPDSLSEQLKLNYYILGVQIHKSLADRCFDPSLKSIYSNRASLFRDSVIKYDPGSLIIVSNKLIENRQLKKALDLMLSSVETYNNNERHGPSYHYIAGLYKQLQMPDSQIYYLIKASEDDLNNGIREYMALTELAEMLVPTDIERAQKYITRSHTDAIMSHSSLRQREVGPIYNTITSSYTERQKRFIFSIILISITLLCILVVIVFTVVILRRKNLQLSLQSNQLIESHAQIEKVNLDLENTNMLLTKESVVKSFYIHSFMELCLSYLKKMESFRANLGRIAAEGDLKKVIKAINSSRYVNQEIAEFYQSFDKAFFSLYPDFIEILNRMLREEERYPVVSKLTTELRVYALIWLGIESSGEIAKFLRCSESTVYNYRTVMRNRAINRTDFENNFKEIAMEKRLHESTI